jgi:hypothetical protein
VDVFVRSFSSQIAMFIVLKLCSGVGCNLAFSLFQQNAGNISFRFKTESAHYVKICMELVTSKQLTPETEILLDKLTVPQLVKKFPVFDGKQKIHSSTPLVSILSQINPIHVLSFLFI